jgi:hypothetical protein
MGDVNQLLFIRRHADRFAGPYLEVGSKDYGTTQDLRSLFQGRGPYVGVDREAGPGVDRVLDLAGPWEAIDAALEGQRFGTIFCLSVLEHCEQPFRMADSLTQLLAPGGHLCVGVPFAYKFHSYPSDYWRFTQEGVKRLFPNLEFRDDGVASTSRPGDFQPLDEHIGRIDFATKSYWRRSRYLRGLSAGMLRLGAKLGPLRWLAGHRYVLAPTMILMIGRREGE